MKRLLLFLSIGVLAISPAIATEYDGGDLQVSDEMSLGTPEELGPAVFMVEYSNVSSFLGTGIQHGGATLQGANTITRLLADDITPTGANAGYDVVQFKFTMVNYNTVPVTVRPRVRFWFADGYVGGPGTYYNVPVAVGYSFNPLTINANTVSVVTATIPAGQFTMPGTTFWAGVTFDDNNGTTGATAAQLNNFGQGIFNPPTIGSSADVYFVTSTAGSYFNVNNPVGPLQNFAGNPPANLGWEFTVDVPVSIEEENWGAIKQMFR